MTDSINNKRRDFLVKGTSAAAAVAVGGSLAACSDSDSNEEKFAAAPEFNYGVASGDPLTDRVILWTHAKFPGADAAAAVPLTWQIATDANFTSVISSGKVDASDSTGFTAKVDATGLTAGVDYFYRFQGPRGSSSIVGTTRTLPAANVTSLKFAVFSCSLYSEGFFNAYDAAAKTDAQYAIHLGDYIYEYGAAPTQFGNTDAVTLGRVTVPTNDIVSLADYRAR
jgi:alkaline phosphatase D